MLGVNFSLPFVGMWLGKEEMLVHYLVEMEVRLPLAKTLGKASGLPCPYEIQCTKIHDSLYFSLPLLPEMLLMDRWKRGQIGAQR